MKNVTAVKASDMLISGQRYLLDYLKSIDELRTKDRDRISIPTDMVFELPMPQIQAFNVILRKLYEKGILFIIILLKE